jgi:hypothetical protein
MEGFTATKQMRFHTSVEDLKENASRLQTKRMLRTHMGEDVRELLAARKLPFEAARDGQQLEF